MPILDGIFLSIYHFKRLILTELDFGAGFKSIIPFLHMSNATVKKLFFDNVLSTKFISEEILQYIVVLRIIFFFWRILMKLVIIGQNMYICEF